MVKTAKHTPLEAEEKAIAALTKPQPGFGNWRAARAEEENERYEGAVRNAKPGDLVEGQGVYIGVWQPKDRDGNSLCKIFNVFAAPQDLTGKNEKTLTYDDTVKRVAELENWHGFDGGNYANDIELYKALADGSYKGEWIVPPCEILIGINADAEEDMEVSPVYTQLDNLYLHHEKGSLKGTFRGQATPISSDFPHFYWSSTESKYFQIEENELLVRAIRIWDGLEGWHNREMEASCRPVRLVPVAPERVKP